MRDYLPIGVIAALRDEMQTIPTIGDMAPITVQSGLGRARLETALGRLLSHDIKAVLVWGTCGALDPGLRAGELLLYSAMISAQGQRFEAAPGLRASLAAKLTGVEIHPAIGFTATAPVNTPEDKARLRTTFHADCVDMESAIVAALAQPRDIPVAVLRAVVDPAGRSVPAAALAAMQPDGSTRIRPALTALLRSPTDLPDIIRLSAEYRHAMRALRRAAAALWQR